MSEELQEELAWDHARDALKEGEKPTEEQMLEELADIRQWLAKGWRALNRAGIARWEVEEAFFDDDEPGDRGILLARRALEKRGLLPRQVQLVE